jgi:hypothetical protein
MVGESVLSCKSGTCSIRLILILIATVVVAAGLTVGLAIVRPVGSRVVAIAPATPTVFPLTLILTAPVTVAEDALSVISPTAVPQPFFEGPFAYGYSLGGRPLLAYRFGTGPSVHVIIGGIHGGYEWNTVVLVSQMLKRPGSSQERQDTPSRREFLARSRPATRLTGCLPRDWLASLWS